MRMRGNCVIGVVLLGTFVLIGFVRAQPASDEAEVRRKFGELQAAMAKKDTEKIWALLSTKSQSEAEKTAKEARTFYAKASADEKAKLAESLGIKEAEIKDLTGPGMLKTKRFRKKYDELHESKIEKVVIQGDNATVHFLEPDGDHEKAILLRQDKQWMFWLAIPKLSK